jgi:hypothetical protein
MRCCDAGASKPTAAASVAVIAAMQRANALPAAGPGTLAPSAASPAATA